MASSDAESADLFVEDTEIVEDAVLSTSEAVPAVPNDKKRPAPAVISDAEAGAETAAEKKPKKKKRKKNKESKTEPQEAPPLPEISFVEDVTSSTPLEEVDEIGFTEDST